MGSRVGDESKAITLHKRERAASGYWGHPGISTVTFCTGDAKSAFAALKPKVRAVMELNPWIAGRFEKKQLVCPTEASDALVDEMTRLTSHGAITRTTPYAQLVKATGGNKDIGLASAGKLQSAGAMITKLVVVEPASAGDEFAIVFSMSHAAADGHDYYKIFEMIAGNAPAAAMTPERVGEYETCEPEWTGPKDFKWLSGGGLIKGMLGGLLFGPKSSWCCYGVDAAKLTEAKKAAAAEASTGFVSTNDVLTSHFCRATAARVCMMVVNMRGKIRLDIGDSNAGCYEGCMLLDPPNYAAPAAVRKCVAGGVPLTRQTDSAPLPGLCGSCPMAFITSWASFPWGGLAALDGVTAQTLHLPCMNMPDMMDVAVVFKPRPGELAMLCLAKRAKPQQLQAGGLLGASLEPAMFPV